MPAMPVLLRVLAWLVARCAGLSLLVLRLLGPPVFYFVSLWAVWRAAQKHAKAKWRAEVLSNLATASDADLELIVGELPPWVKASMMRSPSGA